MTNFPTKVFDRNVILLERAESLLEQGEYFSALSRLRSVCYTHPSPDVLEMVGDCLALLNLPHHAILHYQYACRLEQDSSYLHARIIDQYVQVGETFIAQEYLHHRLRTGDLLPSDISEGAAEQIAELDNQLAHPYAQLARHHSGVMKTKRLTPLDHIRQQTENPPNYAPELTRTVLADLVALFDGQFYGTAEYRPTERILRDLHELVSLVFANPDAQLKPTLALAIIIAKSLNLPKTNDHLLGKLDESCPLTEIAHIVTNPTKSALAKAFKNRQLTAPEAHLLMRAASQIPDAELTKAFALRHLQTHPFSFSARMMAGIACHNRGETDQAQTHFSTITRICPLALPAVQNCQRDPDKPLAYTLDVQPDNPLSLPPLDQSEIFWLCYIGEIGRIAEVAQSQDSHALRVLRDCLCSPLIPSQVREEIMFCLLAIPKIHERESIRALSGGAVYEFKLEFPAELVLAEPVLFDAYRRAFASLITRGAMGFEDGLLSAFNTFQTNPDHPQDLPQIVAWLLDNW